MEVQGNFGPILTQSPKLKQVISTVARVAKSDVNILIMGESGTGKNLLSRAIHNASHRRKKSFISVNCAAIPETLIESELFGREKGAYTGAHESKRGCVEAAKGGTIFFDEIGDMPLISQGKLLQVVEEKKIRRLGSDRIIDSDVRVVSATNKKLNESVREGSFREDLFYRLNEVSIEMPPLRERREDIPFLIRHFVECYGRMYGNPALKISKAAVSYLSNYGWPGNFREMKNVIKSAVLLCPKDTVWLEHFPFEVCLREDMKHMAQGSKAPAPAERDFSLNGILKSHIQEALHFFDGNKSKTAKALNISRPRLDRFLTKLQIPME